MCDNSTKYVVDAIAYLGKGTVPDGQAAEFYVKKLVTSIKSSNRNLTMDNWFCNVPLILSLLNDEKLTVIGTIKKKKKTKGNFHLSSLILNFKIKLPIHRFLFFIKI